MHELGHLFERYGEKKGHVDIELVGPQAQGRSDKPPAERKADRRASDWLVPFPEMKPFFDTKRLNYSRSDLIAVAQKLKRHPGILVGRLQYEGKMSYSYFRDQLVKIRDVVTEN